MKAAPSDQAAYADEGFYKDDPDDNTASVTRLVKLWAAPKLANLP
jgi:hypothetical protein